LQKVQVIRMGSKKSERKNPHPQPNNCQNISLYEPEQSLSLSQDEGEGAEEYPKQSSLERSF